MESKRERIELVFFARQIVILSLGWSSVYKSTPYTKHSTA